MFDDETLKELAALYQEDCGFINTDEFRDIVLKFLYVGRMLRRYVNVGTVNFRLLLNHVIVLHNVFAERAIWLLLDYISDDIHPQLYAVLYFLNHLPEQYDESLLDEELYTQLMQEINDG